MWGCREDGGRRNTDGMSREVPTCTLDLFIPCPFKCLALGQHLKIFARSIVSRLLISSITGYADSNIFNRGMDTLGKEEKELRRELEQWVEWRLPGERNENANKKIKNPIGPGR